MVAGRTPRDLRERLAALHASVGLLTERARRNALRHVQWTRPQQEWLSCDADRKLFRSGNQFGKTWAGLAEVIYRATGTHPYYEPREPPVEIWIVCTSWSQSVAIMGKFWALVPKDQIRPTSFDPRRGFGKDNPAVVFKNGSVVRFKTTNQGPEALAGATIDYIHIDEPCDEEVYRELDRRVERRAGQIGITLTPINRPCDWLKKLCEPGPNGEDPAVVDVHYRMEPENFIPLGSDRPLTLLDGTPMDEAWIAKQRAKVIPRYAPIVLDGEWEGRVEGSLFRAFDTEKHVSTAIPEDVDLKVLLGIDHGMKTFKEAAILLGVNTTGEHPKVYGIDEYIGDGETTAEQDADAILAMLSKYDLAWKDLEFACGDKPYDGRRRGVAEKSNRQLMAVIAKRLGLPRRKPLQPTIFQAKTGKGGGRGSVDAGCDFLHQAMLRPGHFVVHPRMVRSIECFQKWDGAPSSDFKDAIDGWRYALWELSVRPMRSGPVRGVRLA